MDPQPLEQAFELTQRGRISEAESLFRKCLAHSPGDFRALLGLATTLEALGRPRESLQYYERASALSPGNAFPFTRRAVVALREAWGPPPVPRTPSSGDRISMTTLGANGRFGNQLLQYAFLKLYARARGVDVEVPDWVGRYLFRHSDPLPSRSLPVVREVHFDPVEALHGRGPAGPVNVDIFGYFNLHTAAYLPYRGEFRRLFRFGELAERAVFAPLSRLKAMGRTLVAVHIRRGDFGGSLHWIAPTKWYDEWLDALWESLDEPVLYVATDDESVVGDFRRFAPVQAADIWEPLRGAEFLLDFFVLKEADLLATSNSTFSSVAALLNKGARRFARPHSGRSCLVDYDPWDAPILLAHASQTREES